jgi:hypothetical protein
MSLQGYNAESPLNDCIQLLGDLPLSSTTSDSCAWFTNGGATRSPCRFDTGLGIDAVQTPLSWHLAGGVCTSYDQLACDGDAGDDAFLATGCHDYGSTPQDAKTWYAIKCGAV